MESRSDWLPRKTAIVVMDANRNKVIVDALDWALKLVVRPRDTVVVLGVFCKTGKKSSSCFPLNMGISNHGIWESLDFSISSVIAEVKPRLPEEEIERKMEQYRVSVQPFYKQCKRNEVKLEMKLAVGLSPGKITITEAQNSKTRWIVLDRARWSFPGTGFINSTTASSRKPDDNTASNLPWKARWYTALEIGGSLRHLHDKCPDGPIAHLSVCSSHVVFLHGCSAMLSNFLKAKQLNVNDEAPCHRNSTVGALVVEDAQLQMKMSPFQLMYMIMECCSWSL
ncbi:hypothetical protein SLEP1_g31178 [Rubroshorea leprosula]|uniref:Uncharacterized protein n=1 Tax=Rubroshorea leprosula TaxID=152421 RepID=A0AAV5K2M1_9ROSI|nr:hypothetical protein SLEP1_g31178 [Rubroshorea leprosula]